MEDNRFNCLITAASNQGPAALLAQAIDAHDKLRAVPQYTQGAARNELFSRTVHVVLLSAGPKDPDPLLLIEAVRSNQSLGHLPVFVLADRANPQIADTCRQMGAATVISMPGPNAPQADYEAIADMVCKTVRSVYHPASRLQTGGALMHSLNEMTQDVDKTRYILLIKLHGLKSYNIYKTYDEGDAMLAALADMLCQLLVQRGNHNTVLGHLSSDEFCLITHDRRVDSMCRSILHQSERTFRRFYSPFELMQGFITVEDERCAGNYYLAEIMIAGVEVPTQWDSHPVFLIDMLKELLQKVEKDDRGFEIITL